MKKLIDKNGKLFGKFNLLDTVIIIILLIAVAGVAYKFLCVDTTVYEPEHSKGYITLKLTGLNENEAKNAVKDGDVFRVPNIQQLGKVAKEPVPHNREDNVVSTDGKIYTLENPIHFELIVTLETDELYFRDGNYYLGRNYKILANQVLDVTNGVLPCKATVQKIEFAK